MARAIALPSSRRPYSLVASCGDRLPPQQESLASTDRGTRMACITETLRSEPPRHKPGMAERGVMPQLMYLLRALSATPRHRLRLGGLAFALVIVVCAVAYGQIKLNAWNGAFYDLLARRSFSDLDTELGIFLV